MGARRKRVVDPRGSLQEGDSGYTTAPPCVGGRLNGVLQLWERGGEWLEVEGHLTPFLACTGSAALGVIVAGGRAVVCSIVGLGAAVGVSGAVLTSLVAAAGQCAALLPLASGAAVRGEQAPE
ncbi:hypothetical protein FKM82_031285 [Ascaphus truei]